MSELYRTLAPHYDRIYHFKNYPAECAALRTRLHRMGIPDGSRVLDAACGTGSHLKGLAEHFVASGFDLSPELLAIARAKSPDAPLFVADLRDFSVPEPVDALTSMFSAIGYLQNRDELLAFARCAARAVRPGGVLLIEPWLTKEVWKNGYPSLQTWSGPDLHLARATVSAIDGDYAIADMHWLIAARDQPVQHLIDRHRLWLCPHATLIEVFTEAGFETHFDPDGMIKDRGLLIGTRT